jgi:hypothetical protein
MLSDAPDLALELERRSQAGQQDAKEFHNKFSLMSRFLKDKYYPYVRDNCPYFTDHGENHINSVIWTAGQLIRRNPENGTGNAFPIDNFDLYILLTAIIWHDAGMLATREGHEIAVQKMLDHFLGIAFENIPEQRFVEQVIGAHTGKSVPLATLRDEEHYRQHKFHARAIAAIMRFADEISEDASRVSLPVLDSGKVPALQQIYWYFAKSIQASHPEPTRERVVITIEMDSQDAIKTFQDPNNKTNTITLIEYLLRRIEKVNCERAYCAQHFLRFASIQSIETRFGLLKGKNRVVGYEETFQFGGEYPNVSICEKFFKEHPKWTANSIQQAIQ